jgi:mono/diheme cytochrome c family protein
MKRVVPLLLLLAWSLQAADVGEGTPGYRLFKEYCWGCHHQTAEAFGPSFHSIANKRSREEIMAQIVDPERVSKTLGYPRNSMPAFNDLNATQIKALTDFIMLFKEKK